MEQISISYKNGPRVEIRGATNKKYDVQFFNSETEKLIYQDNISANHFSKANAEYYVPWRIVVTVNGEVIKEETLDLKGKKVLISFESSALGDTLSWVPYVEEFRKKHDCILECATFHNHLFEKEFPLIKFVNRRQISSNTNVVYKIGWFGRGQRSTKNPVDCRTIPLQELICSILGLEYKEIRAKVTLDKRAPLFNNDNYVTISTSSTAQAKYWNHPQGWQQTVDWLNARGYTVVNIGREKNKLRNVVDKTGTLPIFDVVNLIQHSKFFIGISSGLTWLTWAMGMKSIMIAGFTAKWFEFQEDSYRVFNENACNSCFNNVKYHFNRGDWMWCPANKGGVDHFICSKSITSSIVQEQVIQLEEDLTNGITLNPILQHAAS